MRSLRVIIGDADYEAMQDRWDENGGRRRWSVAFPIIESYDITGKPVAKQKLGQEAYDRLFKHASATLRRLTDEERTLISDLEITRRPAINAWIAIEDEIAAAERSELPANIVREINKDLSSALEGMEDERKTKIRKRAAWLANRFAAARRKAGTLFCDSCGFDPAVRYKDLPVKPRTMLDVHHLHPLEEGVRRTWVEDFALLCPTCHRLEHELIRAGTDRTGKGLLAPQLIA